MSSTADNAVDTRPGPARDRTHYLYVAVIAAMVAGIAVGAIWPEFGKGSSRSGPCSSTSSR